jgi:hypothetical protein
MMFYMLVMHDCFLLFPFNFLLIMTFHIMNFTYGEYQKLKHDID